MSAFNELTVILLLSLVFSLIAHSFIRNYWIACAAVCGAMIATVLLYVLTKYPLSISLVANLGFVCGGAVWLSAPAALLIGLLFVLVRRRLHVQ